MQIEEFIVESVSEYVPLLDLLDSIDISQIPPFEVRVLSEWNSIVLLLFTL